MFQQPIPEESLVRSLPEIRKERAYRFPHVTIFMPFETKLKDKRGIEDSLSRAVNEASSEMIKRYPGDMKELVLQKLKNIIRNLNYNTLRKSIAIFVSPVFEKVLYLRFEMEEKVVVGGHFKIRDIVRSRRLAQQFHVLVLDENEGRIFLDDETSSFHISSDDAYGNKIRDEYAQRKFLSSVHPESVNARIYSFLQRINQSLADILVTRRRAVFVMGNKNLLNQFRRIVHPNSTITGWVEGKFKELSLQQLKQRLQPFILNWQFLYQQHLTHLLEIAANDNSLITGFSQVYENIMKHRGKTLLIGYRYLYTGSWQEYATGISPQKKFCKYSYLKDAIDEMIEKMLEDDGDVELVDDGVLADYGQIALITG